MTANVTSIGFGLPQICKIYWTAKITHHFEFAFLFFLIVRDNLKILYIQINFSAYKDYLCSNLKWFNCDVNIFGEKW